jgi:ABC-2 type transport system ATP-binding protein
MSLTVNSISYTYGGPVVLENVSFDISPGRCTGLLGANGSGKTTLIKCIIGLLQPSGKIFLDSKRPDINCNQYKRLFGLVPDDKDLLDYLTLDEYLSFVASVYNIECSEEIENWMSYFHLLEHRGRILKNYSYGMRKKVQIIAGLLHKPKLLIIDEPTNGLDIEMIFLLKKCLMKLKEHGMSLLISTHDVNFIKAISDDILILHNKSIALAINTSSHNDLDLEEVFMSIISGSYSMVVDTND